MLINQNQMKENKISKQMVQLIQESSPLFEYWKSAQSSENEKERLSKINSEKIYKSGLFLFEQEPYKWETLYQCILRDMILKRIQSTRALKKMLFTLNSSSRSQVINSIEKNSILKIGRAHVWVEFRIVLFRSL